MIRSIFRAILKAALFLLKGCVLFSEWFVEVSGFILLPLIVYLIAFISLDRPASELAQLPEWMFISIILYGEVLKRLVIFYRRFRGFDLKFIRVISMGIIGITISSILLCFSLIAEHKPGFVLPKAFYFLQAMVFGFAVFHSAFVKIWLGAIGGEAELYMKLIDENEPDEAQEGLPVSPEPTALTASDSEKPQVSIISNRSGQ